MIYTIFSTSTKYQHLYISLILKELFPVMKNLLQFDRTTFEGFISLSENRPTL